MPNKNSGPHGQRILPGNFPFSKKKSLPEVEDKLQIFDIRVGS
jgi:hypothetical protein